MEEGVALSFAGISRSAQPFFAGLLSRLAPAQPMVVVVAGTKSQELYHQDLTTWGADLSKPLFYPAWEVFPHESRLPHADVISERLETLVALDRAVATSGPGPLVMTSLPALLQRTFPAADLRQRTRMVSRGDRVDPLDLVEWLEMQGYEPEAQVTQKGEIALRGGILDLFPLTSPWPVRLEFFGDELESLRQFDPLTQISREEITAVTLPPAGELGLLKAAQASGGCAASFLDHLPGGSWIVLCEPEDLEERAREFASQAPAEDPLIIAWPDLLSHARQAGHRIIEVREIAEASSAGSASSENDEENAGAVVLPWPEQGNANFVVERLTFAERQEEEPPAPATEEQPVLELDSLEAFRPLSDRPQEPQVAETQRREFFAQMHRWLRQGYAVDVFCNNTGESQRFSEIWEEYGFDQDPDPESRAATPQATTARPRISLGTIARGFLCETARTVVVTDAEVFGRYRVQRPRRLKSPHALAARSALDIDFADLDDGDYVVHLQHGIGRYLGLTVLPVGAGTRPTEAAPADTGGGQECLVIEYAPSDPLQPPPKLYVPVTEAHLVSKYVGTGKARPPLNTLGGTRWAKAKAQAERAVRDVAGELLAIQAARESLAGHPFATDTPWQREFEGSFIYEETPDQFRAIQETKGDMERAKPMDRLICGDVGFGKTEVGIRAAFKAVMDGKQVAVLVPTTVLAQQHYNTFRDRMADYPVRVELLSRFRTRRAQQKVVLDLATGAVDIVIGTHRLLQSDVAFKELGLVVIDEEQRFGVMHKEKFKMMRRLVDVLTLSATPIPRTLYLALSGARDMSTIQTPPHDRLPVETIVTHYDERLIREAVQRELNRGGQVFFLHNRVSTIHGMGQKLQQLVPHARIVIGHGQMHSDDLEEVMTTFVNGDADVLLSTTIIESGLDIPNANTIIIDRADRFGLSDLYQLRGRVGRYKHQAYAYLLLPRHARLLTDVRKRMSAIKQYSTLGSGFKIAMRDLEIRGAGNLLGSEQSGHITAVGFELYCQLLKQSVSSLKGEKVKPRVDVQVRLDFLSLNPADRPGAPAEPTPPLLEELITDPDVPGSGLRRRKGTPAAPAEVPVPAVGPHSAYVPFNYVSDPRQRIDVYRKLAQASDTGAIGDLEKELRDRFGPLPKPVELLLLVGELKVLAAGKGITSIEVKEDKLMLTRSGDFVMVGSKFPRLTRKQPEARLKEIRRLLLVL